MSIIDRFSTKLVIAEVELACSLPICTPTEEILFLYSTAPNDEDSYLVDEIKHVYCRDNATGAISEVDAVKLVNAHTLSQLKHSVVRPTLFDDDALDAEESYLDYYEKFFKAGFKATPSQEEKENMSNLLKLFNEIIPDSRLKELYLEIGAVFFEFIKEKAQ